MWYNNTKNGKNGVSRRKKEEEVIGLRPQALGGSMTENRRKPPPSPLIEGECGDRKGEGNVVKISSYTHTSLSRTYSERGNVATLLFSKPPNPRRGTSWKSWQTSPFTHIQLSLATFKGEMWWRGSERYLPFLTYSALADFLNEGECSDVTRGCMER